MPEGLPGSGEAEEGTGRKENFIGRVVFSRTDCDCDICEEGRKRASEANVDIGDRDIDHLAHIEVLDGTYEKNQNILGIDVPDKLSFGSKYMVTVGHLENAHGADVADLGLTSLEELTGFLEGNVYEWRDIDPEESYTFTWEFANGGDGYTADLKNLFGGMTNKPNNFLVPFRHVDDPDELSEYGSEESIDVEEASFE